MKFFKTAFIFVLLAAAFLSNSSAFAADTQPYDLRVAVFPAVYTGGERTGETGKKVSVYQWALAEVLSQDIRKIPGMFVLDRDLIFEKVSFIERISRTKKLTRRAARELGADVVVQIQFRFPERNQLESALVLFWPADEKRKEVRRLLASEEDVLEVLDDFALALADNLGRSLTKKQVRWIQNDEAVSLKSWVRYGRGLDFYYKKSVSAMILAREQFRKAEYYDVLFLPPYLALAKTEMFLAARDPASKDEYYSKAYESLRKALFTDSKYLDAYELLSELYYLKGDYVSAVREGLKAVRLNPLSVQSRFFIAKAYFAMNKRVEAERELRKILEIDPANEDARRMLNS